MDSISDICRNRKIIPYDVQTPILVPSFSSRGFRKVGDIFEQVRDEITECSLLSAFDYCYCDTLRNGDIYASDLLFIDSGGYECKELLEADLEAYRSTLMANTWTPEMYSEVLRELRPLSQIVIVTYDDNKYVPLSEQIVRANGLLETHSQYAVDFLLKPEVYEDTINLREVARNMSSIAKFCILGVEAVAKPSMGSKRAILRLK